MPKIRVPPSLAGFVISSVMKLVGLTLRIRVIDHAGILNVDSSLPPLIWVIWHNRIFMGPLFYWHFVRHRRVSVLTSASRDGEILTQTCRHFRFGTARGSSSRKRIAALRESLALLADGSDLCITPDGPRGPRYVLQPGAVMLAQLSQAPVLTTHFRAAKFWTLNTWDRFIIPKPFSRVDITIDAPVTIPTTSTAGEFEAERQRLESKLRAGAE